MRGGSAILGAFGGNSESQEGRADTKVLITGATGFMGARLAKAVAERGDRIKALVLPDEDYSHVADYFHEVRQGDVTNRATLSGIADGMDVVYHLAARVVDYGTREQFYDVILEGTRNMLEVSAGRAGRFVYVSSICACGTGRHMKGMKEADPCLKTGVFYGDAKLEAEEAVKHCAGRFSYGFVIVRPANVIGPRSVWVAEVGRVIRDGTFTYFDGGRYSASLVCIDNLVDGLVLCGTKKEATDQTYFFRDDYDVTWKQYLDDLAAMFGKNIRFSLPFGFAWFLGGVWDKAAHFSGRRPLITRHAVGLMGRDCNVDTTKAKMELGWKTRVSYEEAMRDIEAWVRKPCFEQKGSP